MSDDAPATPGTEAQVTEAEKFLRMAAERDDLRRALRTSQTQVARLRSHNEWLAEAMREAVHECLLGIEPVPPAPPLAHDARERTPEAAVCLLSDWQLGKKTPSYNSEVCAERIEKYTERVVRLTEIQRADHPVRDCYVFLIGDLIEGEMIFPGQAHRIDASLFRQALQHGPEILSRMLLRLLGVFDHVYVHAVIGNHGGLGWRRLAAEFHPETNADAMLYEVARTILRQQQRLTFGPSVLDGERLWHRVVTVGTKRWLLVHGDQIKGYSKFPWYGFDTKVKGWYTDPAIGPFDYVASGHFHTDCAFPVGHLTVYANGSPESDNTYAQEFLAANRGAMQWLVFHHPERGVTAEYRVWL